MCWAGPSATAETCTSRWSSDIVTRKRDSSSGKWGMRACSLGLVGLGFSVRDMVRVSVRDRVGVRVSTFYFSSHQQPAESSIPAGPHFTYNQQQQQQQQRCRGCGKVGVRACCSSHLRSVLICRYRSSSETSFLSVHTDGSVVR